jgi:hypothetical protein
MNQDSKLLAEAYDKMVREATAHDSLDVLMAAAFEEFNRDRTTNNTDFEAWLKNSQTGHNYFKFILQKLLDIKDAIHHDETSAVQPSPPEGGWTQQSPTMDKKNSWGGGYPIAGSHDFAGQVPITRY